MSQNELYDGRVSDLARLIKANHSRQSSRPARLLITNSFSVHKKKKQLLLPPPKNVGKNYLIKRQTTTTTIAMGNICHSGVKFNDLVAAVVKPNFPTQGANGNLHLTAWYKSPRRAKRATEEEGSERGQECGKGGAVVNASLLGLPS